MLKYVFYTHIPRVIHSQLRSIFVQVERIELSSHPWQGRILPLNHTCAFCAPTRTRTWNSGSEDRRDIHFTMGAFNFTEKVLYFK